MREAEAEKVTKQVLVVRKDLHMRCGKIAAQCAHASTTISEKFYTNSFTSIEDFKDAYTHWKDSGHTKICVYVNSEDELLDIFSKCEEESIPCCLITDKGLTEFKGNPTYTVIAVGPYWKNKIDSITSELKLL